MNLRETALEINEELKNKRKELRLSFVEDKHIYYMINEKGVITSGYPSVTKIIKNFHKPFDQDGISLRIAKGDREKQKEILAEWRLAGDLSINMGSRVHYELERELINRYDNYKEVRQPVFTVNEEQTVKSDKMITAGINFLDIMIERGAELLDTELVMGHPAESYVGQCDNAWIMENKDKSGIGFVISDFKSNQPKNFEVYPYTERLFSPFNHVHDNALGHYYLQIPLYGRLLLRMLKNTKFSNVKFLGGVIVLLKDDGEFVEYKVPYDINQTILSMDLTNYLKK